MFVLAETNLFTRPVRVLMPSTTEPGKISEHVFRMTFEAMPLDRSDEFAARMAAATTVAETIAEEAAQIAAVARGWEDVVDSAGRPIPFNAETLASACRWRWFREAVSLAYGQAMRGEEARAGN